MKAENGHRVSVHYKGTLIDGTEFDNSRTRGETLNFDGAAGRITITGKIRTNKASAAATINIDISRFITATVETA